MSEVQLAPVSKEPTINFAIGPNCPVRCEGCYNHFGNTFQQGGLVTAEGVVDFAAAAQAEGVTQATLSGGDPLFHPEIVPITQGLKGLGLKVKLDTVGTALLGDAQMVFKGRGTVGKVDIADIAPHVDFVDVPLDGAQQDTVANFRRGRPNLLNETVTVARLLKELVCRSVLTRLQIRAIYPSYMLSERSPSERERASGRYLNTIRMAQTLLIKSRGSSWPQDSLTKRLLGLPPQIVV